MLVIQLRKLLNVSSLRLIPKVSQAGAYRLVTGTSVDPYVLFTWLRMCDLLTDQHHPSYILIGRLHKEKYLKCHQYSGNKVRYEFEDTNLMTGVH